MGRHFTALTVPTHLAPSGTLWVRAIWRARFPRSITSLSRLVTKEVVLAASYTRAQTDLLRTFRRKGRYPRPSSPLRQSHPDHRLSRPLRPPPMGDQVDRPRSNSRAPLISILSRTCFNRYREALHSLDH